MFRFDNYLTLSPDFIPAVQNIWQHAIVGTAMFSITRKLKALKSIFREQWRKKWDLSQNVELAKGFLEKAQMLVSASRQDELYLSLEHWCKVVLAKAAKLEQIMLQQRAKIQWMKRGEDVKNAIFDIAKDKAPGPNRYFSGFYKAAWPVVGEEVSKAVLDFFMTGRILKQINSTILALIPKAAFVPGWSIRDNILLAEELFSEYKQARRPPRCALKVDIRKAYDTLFGFPDMFNKWVEECVTTPSFLVGMNGKPHGFFLGARGLRQGDPLSPYLFVLVMEVLHMGFLQLIEQDMNFTFYWKCEASKVFQLGFADDQLLFCRANTESIRALKDGLDRFALWFALRLNAEKSHLIISKSAQNVKEQLLVVLGFLEGHLPMRYLGLPLISSRLSISDCQPLLTKIDACFNGWEGLTLSYACRL
ncbi:UNVERIFIED_CONTAM: hypothetical protein Sindi_0374200 [Sesamum indicum]